MRVAHVLDYARASYIHVQLKFASSFRILESSWDAANNEGGARPDYAGGSYIYVQL